MSLVSLASSLLPRPVRFPEPRKSEGEREFDALMDELTELEPEPVVPHGEDVHVVRLPFDGPTRDVARRARH